jgi:hypothetical protein
MEPANGAAALSDDPGDSGSQGCSAEENIPPTPVLHVDSIFNFQLVVFQVGNTLFQVFRKGFEVPGTIFEAMFALPSGSGNENRLEGTSLEFPIFLDGVREDQFRAFLRVLYPFAGGSPVTTLEDWEGVLHLATMWEFKSLRQTAITALSDIIRTRDVKERIFLGFKFRVVKWVREGYVTIAQRPTIHRKELNNSPFPLSWEIIAGILAVRDNISSINNYHCCGDYNGTSYTNRHCRCRTLVSVNQEFKDELQVLEESPLCPAPPLPTTPIEETIPFDPSDYAIAVSLKKKKKKK